jgi:hypothetical protein
MMMEMLQAGGMQVLTDNLRRADIDNPRGYFEFERVKGTGRDPSWLDDAIGGAVKMAYLLLYDLPPKHEYRIIFMRRHLAEVVASQDVMLSRSAQTVGGHSDAARFMRLYSGHLERILGWLQQQPNFSTLQSQYQDVIDDPQRSAFAITRFLGIDLDSGAMTRVPDSRLHRQRVSVWGSNGRLEPDRLREDAPDGDGCARSLPADV